MITEFRKKNGNDYFQAEEKKHTLTSEILQKPKKENGWTKTDS